MSEQIRKLDMSEMTKILVADDDRNVRTSFRELLRAEGFEVIEATNGLEAVTFVESHSPLMMFLDISMPGLDGHGVLEEMKKRNIEVPVVVITGSGTMGTTIKAIRAGAYEYLTKPLDLHRIRLLVTRCLEERQLKSEIAMLREKITSTADRYELVGSSPVMLPVFKAIGSVASTSNTTNILIIGETGTGKELVARQLHSWGEHPNEPFLAMNVGVLPDTLFESELFGHEKGAFTGADQRKLGKFEMAKEGVIFLDEIGDLEITLQQKLLRVIQEREFARLGGHESIPVKARFIASTHDDLDSKVEDGRFRRDLFFRLNLVTIRIPPLRDRRDDIPLLAHHFVRKYSARAQRNPPYLPPETISHLMAYHWPGNVRELENAVARAMVHSKSERLLPSDIPLLGHANYEDSEQSAGATDFKNARRIAIDAFEKRYLEERLMETNGNVTHAAQRAGINRQSFQRLMQKYGIVSQDHRPEKEE